MNEEKLFSLSIFIPAFNELQNLRPTVETLLNALGVFTRDFEIIIVNDGSTDGTPEIADQLAASHPCIRVLHNGQNRGLGYCFLRAMKAAKKDNFLFVPGDNTWPCESLLELFGNFGKADIITCYPSNPEVRSRGRRIISQLFTTTLSVLFQKKMRYFNGITIYPIEHVSSIRSVASGFACLSELLLKGLHRGYTVVEVGLPITERVEGESKAVKFKNIVNVIVTVIRLFFELRISNRLQNNVGLQTKT